MIFTFQRKECKFRMSRQQYEAFREKMLPHFQPDAHGPSRVHNIYFDNEQNELFRASIDAENYKEKIRLRWYGEHPTAYFLELKKKWNGYTYKRRITLTEAQKKQLLETNTLTDDSQIGLEIQEALKLYKPVEQWDLAYDRVAFICREDSDLRVTFDTNIACNGKLLFDEDIVLMEIKSANPYPLWLCHFLSETHLFHQPFSKIGTAYTSYAIHTKEISKC